MSHSPKKLDRLLGRVRQYTQGGHWSLAEGACREILRSDPSHVEAWAFLGMACGKLGRVHEGREILQEVLKGAPGSVTAWYFLGGLSLDQGQTQEAIPFFEQTLKLEPKLAAAWNDLGAAHQRIGHSQEATACFRRALDAEPNFTPALLGLAHLDRMEGRFDEAESGLKRVLVAEPKLAQAWNLLGQVHYLQRRLAEAEACFRQAVILLPSFVEGLNNLGLVLLNADRCDEAEKFLLEARRTSPKNPQTLNLLNTACRERNQLPAALNYGFEATAAALHDPVIHYNLGLTLGAAGRFEEAAHALRIALHWDPEYLDAEYFLGHAYQELNRPLDAIACFTRVLERDDLRFNVWMRLLAEKSFVCDWGGVDKIAERVVRMACEPQPGQKSTASPFGILSVPSNPEQQLIAAKRFAAQWGIFALGQSPGAGFTFAKPSRERMRIGYLSSDFKVHATSFLLAEVLELHDRSRFEIIAYDWSKNDGSAIRERIRRSCDHFHEIHDISDDEAAARIHHDGIDLLIDLKGYTDEARTGILARKPAPVQVNWLGYPGTMGAEFIDFILADSFIIPPGAERFYSERVVRLPHCYQCNDRRREIDPRTPTRAEYGLPENAIVLCCFNQTTKLSPAIFEVWMSVLRKVPGAVLWQWINRPEAAEFLRREAERRGIERHRIVFAGPMKAPEHLARYRVADLMVDTFPYTSHTTASDALWVGCPLVTCAGETFASRVAGSVLTNAGLPDLVAYSLEEYEAKIVDLASDPQRLMDLRHRIQAQRDACPLFDTPRFTRDLEAAYEMMFREFLAGRLPR